MIYRYSTDVNLDQCFFIFFITKDENVLKELLEFNKSKNLHIFSITWNDLDVNEVTKLQPERMEFQTAKPLCIG